MFMHWLDWLIVGGLLVFLIAMAEGTKKYMRSVADFLVANRCAGRYLLSVAEGLAGIGALGIIATMEQSYEAGWVSFWWNNLTTPTVLFVSLSGWVIYRYRQTRAMTLAQFLEVRYSKNFRVFAGFMIFICGIINFGIFPLIGSQFFVYFCGFPQELPGVTLLGHAIPTYVPIMMLLLAIAFYFTFVGGQVAVMVTDFFQGMFCNIVFMIAIIAFMVMFGYDLIESGMKVAEPGKSLLNPLDTGRIQNFNWTFFAIAAFVQLYNLKSWQGSQGYMGSARTPHEAKMAGVMGIWRGLAQNTLLLLMPFVAYMIMHLTHGDFPQIAQQVRDAVAGIPENARGQMIVPSAITRVLPMGLVGALAAVFFSAFISNVDTYMHSWGSIFIQDVIIPSRRRPGRMMSGFLAVAAAALGLMGIYGVGHYREVHFWMYLAFLGAMLLAFGYVIYVGMKSTNEGKQHMRLLRLSVLVVTLFVFIFGLVYELRMPIFMYFAVTGAIWMGGAGAIIIGGLYWKRGTTFAAYSALILGAILSLAATILDQFWLRWDLQARLIELFPQRAEHIAAHWNSFPINGQYIYFFAMISAVVIYLLVSLLGPKSVHNMDKLLHRKAYAIKDDQASPLEYKVGRIGKILGISPEYTRWDKVIHYSIFAYSMIYLAIFVLGSGWIHLRQYISAYLARTPEITTSWGSFVVGLGKLFGATPVAESSWLTYWHVNFWISVGLAVFTTIWFVVGGFWDMGKMFAILRGVRRDIEDDGTVRHEPQTKIAAAPPAAPEKIQK